MEHKNNNIHHIFLDFSKTDFECPHCNAKYNDDSDKYLRKMNKNKSGITSVKCVKCKNKFYVTYNMKGDIVSFKN